MQKQNKTNITKRDDKQNKTKTVLSIWQRDKTHLNLVMLDKLRYNFTVQLQYNYSTFGNRKEQNY